MSVRILEIKANAPQCTARADSRALGRESWKRGKVCSRPGPVNRLRGLQVPKLPVASVGGSGRRRAAAINSPLVAAVPVPLGNALQLTTGTLNDKPCCLFGQLRRRCPHLQDKRDHGDRVDVDSLIGRAPKLDRELRP